MAPSIRKLPVKLALSSRKRALGMLFDAPEDEILVLAPCRDIHTFGMRVYLDVAFLDESGLVLKSRRKVPPQSRLRERRACVVLERVSSVLPWYREGDRVCLSLERSHRDQWREVPK